MLGAVAFLSLVHSALPVPLSKILQNSAAPRVVLRIMGRCKEAKRMMLLMLGPDKFGVFLVVLDSFNQFFDKTGVLRFGDSLFEAIEPLTM